MFCGWRLVNSYPQLERLGSGTLIIDALSQACSFNGQTIEPLTIAGELAAWLREDLAAHHIDDSQLRQATLVAELQFSTVARAERATHEIHFTARGHEAAPALFLSCEIGCKSRVVTDERSYESEYRDREEWPPGWPSPA